jgi:hypothetical protein
MFDGIDLSVGKFHQKKYVTDVFLKIFLANWKIIRTFAAYCNKKGDRL